ncbi:MAG: DNA polymerase III subunit gamma/tau [Actinomycetota bacterium]|nr:DNA polymerase III subunit gamma/tau [Actinomycetota bacterium]
MGYISIYRKWRPQNFQEIVGQDDIVKTLRNAVKTGRLSHAYIFCGPRGTGKTSMARILAKAVNCKKKQKDKNNIEPCNVCENCISITNGTSVDVIEIDAASNRKVEPTRELIEKVNYLPNYLKKKVYIIDEVHMLTDAAFNTLLKTLEEPPDHVMFILATTEPDKVLPTILSRCQRFNFKPISSDSITSKLKMIASKENIDISEAALSLISKYSGGSQRDANVILEKLASLDEDKIKVEDVASLLGVVDYEILFELINILIEKNVNELLFFEHRLQESYQNIRIFVEEFLNHLQILFIVKNYESAFEIINVNAEYKEKYLEQAKLVTSNALQFFIELFTDLYKEIKVSEGSKILFRSALIKAVTYHDREMKEKGITNTGIYDERLNFFESEIRDLNNKIFEVQKNLYKFSADTSNKMENKVSGTAKKEKEFREDLKIDSKKDNLNDYVNQENIDDGNISQADDKYSKDSDKIDRSVGNDLMNEIKEKWVKICASIRSKEKGIPLYSQFIETKKIKINNGNILFYLPNNYKFHKDNLNKTENLEKIESSLRENLGRQFKINFFFESEGKDLTDIREFSKNVKEHNSEKTITGEKETVKERVSSETAGKHTKTQHFKDKENKENDKDFEYFVDSGEDKIEEYSYLEKKFQIKEKKSGN